METIKTNTGDTVSVTPVTDWKARALKAEAKLEAMDLVVICCRDIIAMWPSVTFRTIGRVTKALDTLAQALKAAE